MMPDVDDSVKVLLKQFDDNWNKIKQSAKIPDIKRDKPLKFKSKGFRKRRRYII